MKGCNAVLYYSSLLFSSSIFSSYFQAVTTGGAGGILPLLSGKPAEDRKVKKTQWISKYFVKLAMSIWEEIWPCFNLQTIATIGDKFLKIRVTNTRGSSLSHPKLWTVTILQCHFLVFNVLLPLPVVLLLPKTVRSSKHRYFTQTLHGWLHTPKTGLWVAVSPAATVIQVSGCCWD